MHLTPRINATLKNEGLRVSWGAIHKFTIAAFVLVLSLTLLPFDTSGDQYSYIATYRMLSYSSITDGYRSYTEMLGSHEFVHFVLCWLASRIVAKNIFIALSNSLLAYAAMALFQKWKTAAVVSYALLLTNFYIYVLYFSAERLKYGILFFVVSIIHQDQIKKFFGFSFLAITSHMELLIIYGGMLLTVFFDAILKFFNRKTPKLLLLIAPPLFVIILILMANPLLSKFQAYYVAKPAGAFKSLGFFILAMWYSDRMKETAIFFSVIVSAAFLVGGFRVNMLAYFGFLYYGLRFKRGLNLGMLATSTYFAYASILFVENILRFGSGFTRSGGL